MIDAYFGDGPAFFCCGDLVDLRQHARITLEPSKSVPATSVAHFARYDASHTAPRILDIATPTKDQRHATFHGVPEFSKI
jgi:hypothetical protein